jgi:endonuclease III
MKHGAEYAKRIKHLYNQLRRQYGKPQPPDHTDPLEQLILGILARGTTDTKAQGAFRRLRENLVDHNELRVTPCVELAETLGTDLPDVEAKARNLVDALNAIYDRHNVVDLAFLRDKSVRDAREYLRSLPGVDEFAAARVVLYSLGGHAIPVDEGMMQVLRKEELISPDATVAEVQTFLERHVPSSEAAEFSSLLHRYTAGRIPKAPPVPDNVPQRSARSVSRKAIAQGDGKASGSAVMNGGPEAGEKVAAKNEASLKARPAVATGKKPPKAPPGRPAAALPKRADAGKQNRRT